MFLDKKYILANELIEKMNISPANISNARKHAIYTQGDDTTFIKVGSITFVNTKSNNLTKNFKTAIANNTFTDMSYLLPKKHVLEELDVTEKDISSITETVYLYNKPFLKFNEQFVQQIKNKVLYVLNEFETFKCLDNNQISGYIKLKNNKYLTWYNLYV